MENVKELYETTDMTLQEIAKACSVSDYMTWKFTVQNYSVSYRKQRKVKNYSKSKLGNLNPQFGKKGSDNHKYMGRVSDGKGYMMVLKPDWYTGRKGTKHIFEHHFIICQNLGLTEIPRGWCVHHIDEDKTNNDLNNLAFMTTAAHSKLHSLERATTRAKARRVQVDSKQCGEVA